MRPAHKITTDSCSEDGALEERGLESGTLQEYGLEADGLEADLVATVRERRWPRLGEAFRFSDAERSVLARHASPGWGAHEDALRLLAALVHALRPERILEFGSGVSSLVVTMALRRRGGGELLSIDESSRYADRTRTWLAEESLSERAEVLHCPVRRQRILARESYCYDLCYDLGSVADRIHDLDMVFIDGPNSMPVIGHPGARFGTLPLIRDRLAPGALLILDDAGRRVERRIAARWAELDGIRPLGTLELARGLSIFSYQP